MNKPPTPELAFRLGAEAMRTHLAAWAMAKGLTPIAIDILNMALPKFSLPETITIEAPGPAGQQAVTRQGCEYLAARGSVCNKCGRVH